MSVRSRHYSHVVKALGAACVVVIGTLTGCVEHQVTGQFKGRGVASGIVQSPNDSRE